MHFQFERLGFYVIDKDSVITQPSKKNKTPSIRLIFNLTVTLSDSNKPKDDASANRSRKAQQEKQLAEKMVIK
jgi:hypothetical protein